MHSVTLTTSLLIILEAATCANAIFLDSYAYEIPAGNFSYFSVKYTGTLFLVLSSHEGDCDIYISQYERKPTFENYAYCLQSSSCGVDTIIVPESFKRPIAIGVYGHPSHEVSKCVLGMYEVDGKEGADTVLEDLHTLIQYGSRYKYGEGYYFSDFESLPFLMIFIYYLYNIVRYFLDLSAQTQLTPSELFEIFLELLFF